MSTEKSSTPFNITELPVVRTDLGLPGLRYSSPTSIEGLTALPQSRFPTVAELAALSAAAPAPSPRDLGLFEAYMHKRPELLLQAVQEKPGRFGEGVDEILQELYARSRSFEELTPEEQEAINLATAEFFAAPRMAKETQKPPTPTKQAPRLTPPEVPVEQPSIGPDLDPFWWT